jgi:hypothetical protein
MGDDDAGEHVIVVALVVVNDGDESDGISTDLDHLSFTSHDNTMQDNYIPKVVFK